MQDKSEGPECHAEHVFVLFCFVFLFFGVAFNHSFTRHLKTSTISDRVVQSGGDPEKNTKVTALRAFSF